MSAGSRSAGVGLEQWLEEVRSEYWERLAAEVEPEAAPGAPHVLFRLGGETLAVEASLCKAVVRRSRVARLPGLPPHVLGVAGIRGEVVSATDPMLLLGVPGERSQGRGYFLLLASGEMKTALWVDWVDDVVPLDEARWLRGESPWPGAPEGLVSGQWQGRNPPAVVVDGHRLLEWSAVRPAGEDGRSEEAGARRSR